MVDLDSEAVIMLTNNNKNGMFTIINNIRG